MLIIKPLPMGNMTESPATTPIPVQLSEPEFIAFIFPHLSMPEVLAGPKDIQRKAWNPLHDNLQSFREMVRRWIA